MMELRWQWWKDHVTLYDCRCVRGRWPSWTLWAAKCWIRGSTIWGVVPRNSNPIIFTTITSLSNYSTTPKTSKVIPVFSYPRRRPSRERTRIAPGTSCLGHRFVYMFNNESLNVNENNENLMRHRAAFISIISFVVPNNKRECYV